MKKIIIHCGMPKTGTSALQAQLAQRRSVFLENGYNYLNMGIGEEAKDGRITSGNGARIARAYRSNSKKMRTEETSKLRQAISQAEHNVIISSEFFATIPHKQFGELIAAISDLGDVQLVFFVREQVNALASGYIQQVKRSMLTKFPDEHFQNLNLSTRKFLAYNTYFKSLSAMAPDATILVTPYELSKTHSAGLMGLFLEMINAEIPAGDHTANQHINLSPSPSEVRLMIEANKYHPRMRFSDMLVEASLLSKRSKIYTDHSIIPPEAVTKIRTFFAAENEKFFKNFTKCDNLYRDIREVSEFSNLREVTFDVTDVMDIILGILVKMDSRIARLENDKHGAR